MDATDRKILAELQQDGRLTLTELADRVQLTLSPAHRRLRDLEQRGVISGYRAMVEPEAVGLGFQALVFVTMREATQAAISAFEAAVEPLEHIVDAQRLFGEPDYLLRVVARDLPHFQQLYDEELSALPGVQRVATTLVMRKVVDGRALPV
ncbi:Lrp/AsnC family transcriptional regulator [Microbacterium sp. NIBRBAC000506063]|uniref:Lrp/AsnC family transcriptional regulator n=1 Tax=Microbacterium sp. NIBRBAC000506063 TaxID=2734618 RepID=UPI001BB70D27|nr:Lrp/AsnC family transcriptional regulator [Microbacterium sp. NIBRBAC000506063]QTV80553.1 Lrp/AsnC family transcriptional regulator [Microbacterium sp. NIBRBAC000506063]